MESQISLEEFRKQILQGIPEELPNPKPWDPSLNHAPKRKDILTREEKKLALKNALRYFPSRHHEVLATEFAKELKEYGRIYMHRFRPEYKIYARRFDDFPHRSKQAAAIMLMLSNNLDHAVAQHPRTYYLWGKWCSIPELGSVSSHDEIPG